MYSFVIGYLKCNVIAMSRSEASTKWRSSVSNIDAMDCHVVLPRGRLLAMTLHFKQPIQNEMLPNP